MILIIYHLHLYFQLVFFIYFEMQKRSFKLKNLGEFKFYH